MCIPLFPNKLESDEKIIEQTNSIEEKKIINSSAARPWQ